ncbi:MAG TPA: hypothetical protein VN962_12300 [Polyangia bacterium]|nr:hypothetical protein [Polyangia bacterium]
MRSLLWLVPVAFFFLNPSLGCVGPEETQFQYGATEMQAAIAGTWTFNITPNGGTAVAVTVQLDEADNVPVASAQVSRPSLIRAAHACGSRTLVKSAAACTDVSSMPLAITFISGDPSLTNVPLSGVFRVTGTTFQAGSLEVDVGPYQLSAVVLPDGTVSKSYVYVTGQGATATVTITRS